MSLREGWREGLNVFGPGAGGSNIRRSFGGSWSEGQREDGVA